MSNIECLNCHHLGECHDADLQKLLEHHRCMRWEASSVELINARNAIIRNFGNEGLKSILKTKPKEK